jgi:hypothetical protein
LMWLCDGQNVFPCSPKEKDFFWVLESRWIHLYSSLFISYTGPALYPVFPNPRC